MVISAHETLLVQGSWHFWFMVQGSWLKVHDYDAGGKLTYWFLPWADAHGYYMSPLRGYF